MKPQVLVTYVHEDKQLFFVSAVNQDRVDIEAKVEKQYSRARSFLKNLEEQKIVERNDGFLFALVNTNFFGWKVDTVSNPISDKMEFLVERQYLIDTMNRNGWYNVGSDTARMKGTYGAGTAPYNWNTKLDVTKMTRAKIYDRVNKLMIGSDFAIDDVARRAAYYAITLPDSHGPYARNFGNYTVNSIASLYLFLYHYTKYTVKEAA